MQTATQHQPKDVVDHIQTVLLGVIIRKEVLPLAELVVSPAILIHIIPDTGRQGRRQRRDVILGDSGVSIRLKAHIGFYIPFVGRHGRFNGVGMGGTIVCHAGISIPIGLTVGIMIRRQTTAWGEARVSWPWPRLLA